ncbi:MAG: hypothetical protein ACRC1H_19525, partial [Caldilineaceae bacterium]
MNPAIRITIWPELARWRPEVTWAWRTMLETIGWSWHEVPFGCPAEIVYGGPEGPTGQSVLHLRAEVDRWSSSPNIESIRRTGRLVLPRYADADTNAQSDDGVDADAIEDSADSASLAASIAQERDLVFDFFWLV